MRIDRLRRLYWRVMWLLARHALRSFYGV